MFAVRLDILAAGLTSHPVFRYVLTSSIEYFCIRFFMKIEIYQCLIELGAQLNEFNIFI